MEYPDFIGGRNLASSTAADASTCINLYPEVLAAPGASPKVRMILLRKPGLKLLQTLPDAPGRGKFSVDGRDFAVYGGSFFELLTPTTAVQRGALATQGASPVMFAATESQLGLLADGAVYMFTLNSNAFAKVTSAGLPAAPDALVALDDYFICLQQSSNQFTISAPLDGFTWDALDFASSSQPDYSVSLAVSHGYLWIFGQKETIPFQDTGNANFPFERVPGSVFNTGLAAQFAIAGMDNTLFWLAQDETGGYSVNFAQGFQAQRVSTHSVETAIGKIAKAHGVSDAVAYAYSENGHLFYVLAFPAAGIAHVFDRASGMWATRGSWDLNLGRYTAPRERFHSFNWGMHLVSDYANGNVYEANMAYADDAGAPIRWERTAPFLSKENKFIFYSEFRLDMETGGGLPDGSTPLVIVSWSDTGGKTWSNVRGVSCGRTGEYTLRVVTRRMGRARNRVYKVAGMDAIPSVALIGAELELEVGSF